CGICSYGTKHHGDYKKHITKHERNEVIECSFPGCAFKFLSKIMRTKHLKSEHGIGVDLRCRYCGVECRCYVELTSHEINHTGEKPFECDECDFRAARKSNLDIHKRIHSDEKLFHCP